ncbi:MAG: DUF4126 domain-containing protein [Erythrobacter sp.]|jgi:uncharacterized membrane protein|nr:DUF4126 domain-containing protein [Erythrobacter sp.]
MMHALIRRRNRPARRLASKPLIGPLALGILAGQRALTPLAGLALAGGTRRHPVVSTGALVLAAGEMVADASREAPDRTEPGGLAVRFVTGAVAAGAFARPGRKTFAAALGGLAAVASAQGGLRLRQAAMARFGRIPAAVGEDIAVLSATAAIILPRR